MPGSCCDLGAGKQQVPSSCADLGSDYGGCHAGSERKYRGGVSETQTAPGRSGTPTLRWAVGLLLFEAAALIVLGLVLIWVAAAADSVSVSSAAATCAFAVVLGVILGALGYALRRTAAFARGPAIVLQMLMLPIGYYMIDAGLVWLGVPVMVFGLAGAGLLLAPSTRIALGIGPGAS